MEETENRLYFYTAESIIEQNFGCSLRDLVGEPYYEQYDWKYLEAC